VLILNHIHLRLHFIPR